MQVLNKDIIANVTLHVKASIIHPVKKTKQRKQQLINNYKLSEESPIRVLININTLANNFIDVIWPVLCTHFYLYILIYCNSMQNRDSSNVTNKIYLNLICLSVSLIRCMLFSLTCSGPDIP